VVFIDTSVLFTYILSVVCGLTWSCEEDDGRIRGREDWWAVASVCYYLSTSNVCLLSHDFRVS
jgi:hypothetical protein